MRKLFKVFGRLEKISAFAQGKGYGAGAIKQEVKLATSFFKFPPKLAVDIGGNVGEYTAALRGLYSSLEIHVFEPAAGNVAKLKNRFGADSGVNIVQSAVSNSSGSATLFSNSPGSGLASLVKRRLDHFDINFDLTESVSTIRFEEYWGEILNGRQLDLVKIDIEGHELSALEGFGDAINNVKVVQFEFGGCNIDTRTYFQDFWYFFKEHGFRIYRITPFGLEVIHQYTEADEFFTTTNYLAVK